jgi:hypothetical protein
MLLWKTVLQRADAIIRVNQVQLNLSEITRFLALTTFHLDAMFEYVGGSDNRSLA